jgi:serine/threonine protein kinase
MGESAKQLLGGFRLEEIVGLGAQGRVWRAVCEDASLGFVRKGDQVALKIKDAPDDDGEKWRDHEERVSLLKTMDHPNVVRYLGSFRVNDAGVDKHVIVQELLVGETLKARLKSLSLGLDVDEALRIVKAAATALEYTSGLGIHHRDIKPGNIFLCSDGGVKLIDFGVAKQGDGTVTESGNVRGTFDYLAPDFISPEFRGDERSDIFSLGVVLHEVVTSALPYVEDGKGELGYVSRWARHANSNETPIFVKPLARRVLRGVEDVLRKALAPEREKRYASFTEFRAGLDSVGFNDLKNGDRTYRWLKFIGKGGFGEVFKAKWLETGEAVAVKRLLNPTYAKRFHTEAKVMQQLQDPCFVSFVDFFVNGENAFLVMRFLDGMPGGSLRDAIDRSKRAVAHNGEPDSGGLPKPLVLSAFERYARGLSLLHRRKPSIIHRDIKPSNLYYPEGRPDLVAIMDFGIVREEDSSFTSGVPPCTFDYAPPEIATTTDKGSPGMDIFALGLCLYEALTGKTAYPRIPNGMPGLRMFIERCTSMRAPVFSDPRVQEDPELLDLLRRMTDPDVSKRITDAEEVAIALRRLFFRKATDDDCAPTMVFDNANAEAETRPIDEKQLMEWYRAWVEQHPGQSPFAAIPSAPAPAPHRKRTMVAMVLIVMMAAVGGAFLWPQVERLLNPPQPNPMTVQQSVVAEMPVEEKPLRKEQEEAHKKREEEEAQRAKEKAEREAEERKREEERKKSEETRRREEELRKVEEEKRRAEEAAKLKEQAEALKRLEAELKRKEEERLAREEKARKEEELRKVEEEKRRAEEAAKLKEQAEALKHLKAELKRKEEQQAKERLAREEKARKEEEAQKRDAARREAEEKKRKEEEKVRNEQVRKMKVIQVPRITAEAKGFYEEADFRYENQDYGGAFENYYRAFKAGYQFNNGDKENIKDAFSERMTTLKNLINRIKAALEIGRTPPRDLKETEEERSGLIEKYREMRIHLK